MKSLSTLPPLAVSLGSAGWVRRLLTLTLLIIVVMGAREATAATTRWVNDDDPNGASYAPPGTSCNDPGYQTVQDAVDAAGPGDHINVCPGVYTEQVTIPAGKDNIRLRSTRQWEAVIKAPAVMAPDPFLVLAYTIVRIAGAQNATILAFTITGPGPGGCASLHFGVRVHSGGSANILGNHITDIRDLPPPPAVSGCQNGVAVLVGRRVDNTTGSARIIGNVIESYQKNGPTVDNEGSHAEIAHNRILGVGPTTTIAQNGVQVSRGATAEIQHNFVSGHVYSPGTAASTGILSYAGDVVRTIHNTLTLNDIGAYAAAYQFGETFCGSSAGSLTGHNRVRASSFDGIALDGLSTSPCYFLTGIQVAHNKSDHNSGPGIGVYDASGNAIQGDWVEHNSDTGILLSNADDSTVGENRVRNNGTANGDLTDGIRVNSLSMDNTLQKNHLKDNVTHDCHDDSLGLGTAGTANTWVNNHGESSSPTGLCSGDADDSSFATTAAFGWDANYPWYDAFDGAADYDWAAAYATIDTEGLLQLLPEIRTGTIRGTPINPHP